MGKYFNFTLDGKIEHKFLNSNLITYNIPARYTRPVSDRSFLELVGLACTSHAGSPQIEKYTRMPLHSIMGK